MHTASLRPEASPEHLQRKRVRLKFGVQKKIHLTFIHQWVAYTDNCGGDGHTQTDIHAHTMLSGPECDSLFFSPTHPFETAQAHYAFLYIFFFFSKTSHSSKLKSKQGCRKKKNKKNKNKKNVLTSQSQVFLCPFCSFPSGDHSCTT